MTIKNLYPTQRPALDLNFARAKRLDPRVSLTRASVGTYVGNDGLIKHAVDHEPRFDHDPVTGESLGLLVEEQRINRVSWSTGRPLHARGFCTVTAFTGSLVEGEIFTNSNGGQMRLIFFSNNIAFFNAIAGDQNLGNTPLTAASGTITSVSNVISSYNTANGADSNRNYSVSAVTSILGNSIDISTGFWGFRVSGKPTGDACICSIFVKISDPSVTQVLLSQAGGGDGDTHREYDFTTDTFGSITGSGSSTAVQGVQKFPNGWYRFYWGRSSILNTNPVFYITAQNSTGNTVVGGVYLDGAQIEYEAFPSSFIPTAGSTVTRAADVVSLTNTNVYDTDSFTILNEPYGAAAGGSTLNIVGGGQTPVKRTTVYNQELSQSQINTLVKKDDEFWRWRILGSSFALPNFLTDGQVTVDWGDGTVETLTTSEHTFTDGGGYHDVGFRLDSGTYFRPYINNNATHKDKVIALGPAPESMKLNGDRAFRLCTNLEAFDATVDATGGTNFTQICSSCSSLTSFPLIDTSNGTNFYSAWYGCSSLTSFPLIDTSSGTDFNSAWRFCSSLTSFPLIDTSSATSFASAWNGCSSLTSFPLIDTSSVTNFGNAWDGCSSLTSFPLIDTSSGTNFQQTWRFCSSLTSFPSIDTSSGTNFLGAWANCFSLASFPLIDTSSGTNFNNAWANDSSLTNFPANFFDSWTGTPANNCFVNTWNNCSSLTATSVENILNSIDTSGQSAPASGVDITIEYDTGTGTPSVSTAVTNLKSRGWTITLNGVAQ